MHLEGLSLWGCALCRPEVEGGRRMCTIPSYSGRPRGVWGALTRETRPNELCIFSVGTRSTYHLDRHTETRVQCSSSQQPPMHYLSYGGRKEATSRYGY